jgi:hypothetical protein
MSKFILRKRTSGFTTVSNTVINCLKNNLRALGFYLYLLSLPNDWEFYKTQLAKECKVGIKKVDDLLKILRGRGLVNYGQERNEKGQFERFFLEVFDTEQVLIPIDECENAHDEPAHAHAQMGSKNEQMRMQNTPKTPDAIGFEPDGNFCRTAKTVGRFREATKEEITNKEKNKTNKTYPASDDARHAQSRFNDFWEAYPRKQDKIRSEKIWRRDQLDKIADQIIDDTRQRIATEWKGRTKHLMPMPTTYLNRRSWDNDEILDAAPISQGKVPDSVDEDLPSSDKIYHSMRKCYEREEDMHPLAYLMFDKVCDSFGGYQKFGMSTEFDAKRFIDNNYRKVCVEYVNNKSKAMEIMNTYITNR